MNRLTSLLGDTCVELEVQRVIMREGGFLYDQHEAISHVGSFHPLWQKTKAQAINEIEAERLLLYVKGGLLTRVKVVVAKLNQLDPSTWYLKTEPDATTRNNLLSLPGGPNWIPPRI